jgi:hypothetical protein
VPAMFDHTVAADVTLHLDVIRTTGEHRPTLLAEILIATGVAEDSGFVVPRLEGSRARRHP